MREILNDYRCSCGKLLLRGLIITGGVEVKCRYCKQTRTIEGIGMGSLQHDGYILITDEHGRIVKVSSKASRILGYEKEELLHVHIHDLIVMIEPNLYAKLWQALGHKGQTIMLLQTLQKYKDHSLGPIQAEVRSLYTDDERYLVFIIEKKRVIIA